MAQKTLINGVAYSFYDLEVSLSGIQEFTTPENLLGGFTGYPIKSISYNHTHTKTANYENSRYAVSYSYGRVEYSGTVEFSLESLEYIRDRIYTIGTLFTDRSITQLPPIDLTLKFITKGKRTWHTLENVVFTSENTSTSEGNEQIIVSCDFICSYINYNSTSNKSNKQNTAVTLASTDPVATAGDNQGSII